MVGFGNDQVLNNEAINTLKNYCSIACKQSAILFVCDGDGSILAWCLPDEMQNNNLEHTLLSGHCIQDLFKNVADLLPSAQVCSLKTQLYPERLFHKAISQSNEVKSEVLGASVCPVYAGSNPSSWINITVNLSRPTPAKKPRKQVSENIPHAIVDPATGLFLNADSGFSSLIGIPVEELLQCRVEEIGLSELTLNGLLHADRSCMFAVSLNAQRSIKHWIMSENIQVGSRDCLQLWCPKTQTSLQPTTNLCELAQNFTANWQNKPKRILIADDNPLLAETCASILEWAGIEYSIVNNGKDVLNTLETHPFDAILMDLNMPCLNGFDAARIIRAATRPYSGIPIIAMTATPSSAIDLDRQLTNFDAFLQKPFDIEDLKESIETAMLVKLMPHDSVISEALMESTQIDHSGSFAYVPTSFMAAFTDETQQLESIRNDLVAALSSFQTTLGDWQLDLYDRSFKTDLKRFQSMTVTIGACKLATIAKLLVTKIDRLDHSHNLELKAELLEGITDALRFYRSVDWRKFVQLGSEGANPAQQTFLKSKI